MMATGPEHYREAEQLLAYCGYDKRGEHGEYPLANEDSDPTMMAAAQVHAMLAQTAAIVASLSGLELATWEQGDPA